MESLGPLTFGLMFMALALGFVSALLWSQKRSRARIVELEAQLQNSEVARQQAAEDLLQTKQNLTEQSKRLETVLLEGAELKVRLEKEQEQGAQRLKDLEQAQSKLTDTFKALAADTLKQSNTSFLELAQNTLSKFQETATNDLEKRQISISNLVKPVQESLNKFDTRIQDIEKARVGAYESLSEQVRNMMGLQDQLKNETQNLVKALSNPKVRGRWGEIQLRRVVELAGMLNYCDFDEQSSVETEDGRLRPDMTVKLPLGKTIVVDSKAPLSSYLAAMEATDEGEKKKHLEHHARLVKGHITDLGRKSYWAQFKNAPEFVVMFIPGDTFYNAALEVDSGIIEFAVKHNVIPATPTTLIALLKAVSYGWRQETLAKNAQEISDLGKNLYKRISDMSAHFGSVGKNLTRAVESYNKTVGSLESRVLVSARRFNELTGHESTEELETMEPIDSSTRALNSPELGD